MNLKGWQKTGNTNKPGYFNAGNQGALSVISDLVRIYHR